MMAALAGWAMAAVIAQKPRARDKILIRMGGQLANENFNNPSKGDSGQFADRTEQGRRPPTELPPIRPVLALQSAAIEALPEKNGTSPQKKPPLKGAAHPQSQPKPAGARPSQPHFQLFATISARSTTRWL